MTAKRAPVGICDLCGGSIPRGEWYTTKDRARLHCSTTCKATANSRAGASIRSRRAKQRVARGEWYNPRSQMTSDEISRVQSKASRTARLREVRENRWRNPALDDAARAKLSRPRKHSGALARAIDRLNRRMPVSQLTPAEQRAYRAYRHDLKTRRRDEVNQKRQEWWRRRWAAMTPKQRDRQRAKWRAANKRKNKKPPE